MRESIGTRLQSSKFFKILIVCAFYLTIISFIWHIYKYLINDISLEHLGDDFTLLLFVSFVYMISVNNNPKLLKFLRTKTGFLISWIVILTFTYFIADYPGNVILVVLLLIFPILHYTIRYIGKKRHTR